MNNTVFDVDFTRTLPEPLKNDETMITLGKVIAAELQTNIHMARLAVIYARIDELEERLLDILAHDLHIDWYNPDATIELKREIIKDSVRVHKLMGTAAAVERVIISYFGNGEVWHWYEYGGEPHHFRIISTNPSVTAEREREFLWLLEIVKRKSSWLEEVLIMLETDFVTHFGMVAHDLTHEIITIDTHDTINILMEV